MGKPYKVGIAVRDGTESLEYAGLAEVFMLAGGDDAFEVVIVTPGDGSPPLDALVVIDGGTELPSTPLRVAVPADAPSSTDAALRVVAVLLGDEEAQRIARYLEHGPRLA